MGMVLSLERSRLIRGEPGRARTADVRALGYCSLLTLFAGDFSRLLAEDAEMKRTIDEVARQRLGVS
jgi:hypothetical protein